MSISQINIKWNETDKGHIPPVFLDIHFICNAKPWYPVENGYYDYESNCVYDRLKDIKYSLDIYNVFWILSCNYPSVNIWNYNKQPETIITTRKLYKKAKEILN